MLNKTNVLNLKKILISIMLIFSLNLNYSFASENDDFDFSDKEMQKLLIDTLKISEEITILKEKLKVSIENIELSNSKFKDSYKKYGKLIDEQMKVEFIKEKKLITKIEEIISLNKDNPKFKDKILILEYILYKMKLKLIIPGDVKDFLETDEFEVLKNKYDIDNIKEIEIKGKMISGKEFYNILEETLNKKIQNNLEKKVSFYKEELLKLENSEQTQKTKNIIVVIKYGLNISEKDLIEQKEKEIEYNTTQRVIIGHSTLGKPIYAYYKGNPEKGFFGVFADIHGGYEYGTYKTTIAIKEHLENSGKVGWFIIPTINPDGLEIAEKDDFKKKFYAKNRGNSNLVDLNRNFCTKDFKLTSRKKRFKDGKIITFKTGIGKCESEIETQNIVKVMRDYKFNKVISLHSEAGLFYIPDNSIDDKKVTDFGDELKEILPDYKYDLSYNSEKEKKVKIKFYEINERGTERYTGTMTQYIYENYNIPIILIELKKHGKIEERLLGIDKLF